MSALATLNGATATFVRVTIPAVGVWHAEVETDAPTTPLTGSVTLVVDGVTFRGTVLSSGSSQTRHRYRIAAGAAGWARELPGKAYVNDLGVKLANVLGDAARSVGETLGTVSGTCGPAYVRHAGPAAGVLHELAPAAWYVDEAGVTQLGRRPRAAYTGTATRTATDLVRGRIELAPSGLAGLLPGAVVDGVEAIDVEIVLDGALRATVHGRGVSPVESLRRIVETVTAGHAYYAPWEYRVVRRVGDRVDLQAVRVSSGMPDLRSVRVRPSAGCRASLTLGSLVLVSFVNGDPSRPVVTSAEEADAPGFVPAALYLQAGATGASPTEHATSAEALLLAVQLLHSTLATAIAAIPTNPLTPAALAAAYTTLAADAAIATYAGLFNAGALGASTKAALLASLAAKTADTNGDDPGLGWPNVRGG